MQSQSGGSNPSEEVPKEKDYKEKKKEWRDHRDGPRGFAVRSP